MLSLNAIRILIHALVFFLLAENAAASDYTVTGRISDVSGNAVPHAKVSMIAGSVEYAGFSDFDGSYSLRISGIYSKISGLLESGIPYPNPFTRSVFIPFIINDPGIVSFSVYTFSGRKIKTFNTPYLDAGSYRISWDGRTDNGAPVSQGFYVYVLTFRGKTWSGRIVKGSASSPYTAGTIVESVMMPVVPPPASGSLSVPVVTNITCSGYYNVRFTDIIVRCDTVIDFKIAKVQALPYITKGNHVAVYKEPDYQSVFLKGVNLGSSPPGTFPGEIAYAIPEDLYDIWIKRIAEAGFNSIRIYTLHPPVFYEKLANYNNRHPDNPLFLFQGIWLNEIEKSNVSAQYDLILRSPTFTSEIREVIDCVHGNREIPFRPGKSYGSYVTDVSRWTAGFIIGREISPHEVDSTNAFHSSLTGYNGNYFSINKGSATEVFIARMYDEVVTYEIGKYEATRPLSISSWPTLDPLSHPSEPDPDEDRSSFDLGKITRKNGTAGIFATYHAYPYYPNFVSDQLSYRSFSDETGPDSYLGYLNDLRNHYEGIPLVIGEFGVPSSWGSAHQSYSNMNHGGYSEKQQGEKNLRLLKNIHSADCAGGFVFSWMDEWFKPTWIVSMLEAYGFISTDGFVPTRQLWHNIASPEQNFGLVAFEQCEVLPFISYNINNKSLPVKSIEATNDNCYLFLKVEMAENLKTGDTVILAFDTYSKNLGESRLPNGKLLGNRSEFLLEVIPGKDTALYFVTEAYNMDGLTVRFNTSDPVHQKYSSTVTDGAPWKIMRWTNNAYNLNYDEIGRLPVENSSDFTAGERTSAAWNGNILKVRIPWTILYFYDPTQMKVIDGAVSYDGGTSYEIVTTESDGIAVSLYFNGSVVSSADRYVWDKWLVVPGVQPREKESLHVVESGLGSIPSFID